MNRPFRTVAVTFLAAPLAALLAGGFARAADPSLELVQTIVLQGKAGKLDHLTIDAKRERLFLANKSNNTVDIVDLKEGKLLRQIKGQNGVQGLAYAADLDRLFVALGTGGLLNIFDGENYKPLKTIKFTDDADNARYNPATGLVYVAHAEKALAVVDAKTFAVKATVQLPGGGESFSLESARPRLYIACPDAGEVTVVDTEKNEAVAHYPIKTAGNFHAVTLDETAHRLYIACRKEPTLVVMDTETGKEIDHAAIPGGADDLHFDAKRKQLFVSCGDSFLAVLKVNDADHIEVVDKIPTAEGAKTCLYVPETGRLYLAVPRQEGKDGPEIRVFQVK
jgi:DNA-binding beta-propeller fold protein YncE